MTVTYTTTIINIFFSIFSILIYIQSLEPGVHVLCLERRVMWDFNPLNLPKIKMTKWG
jgi:hypothetical protein